MDGQANTATATLQIELDRDGPPVGALTSADGQRASFTGWIELASVIQDWRRAAIEPPTRQPATPSTGRHT
jgi:hypothetical protein